MNVDKRFNKAFIPILIKYFYSNKNELGAQINERNRNT